MIRTEIDGWLQFKLEFGANCNSDVARTFIERQMSKDNADSLLIYVQKNYCSFLSKFSKFPIKISLLIGGILLFVFGS